MLTWSRTLTMHSHTCIYPHIHSYPHVHTLIPMYVLTQSQRGSQGIRSGHRGSQAEPNGAPLHPRVHTATRGSGSEHCVPASTWKLLMRCSLRAGRAVPGPGLAPPGLPAPSCPLPTRSAPVLVSLSSREAPLASHLGLGWASASWLPRLTQSWAGANSELSECGGVEGGCRELGKDGAPPPLPSWPEQTLFSPFLLKQEE